MFSSNSHKDLYNCIISMNSNSKEAENTVNYVKEMCINKSLDFNKVSFEIVQVVNRTPNIGRINAFVKGVANKMDSERFSNANVSYVPNVQPLINELRDHDVLVLANDTIWLSVVWKYIVNWKGADLDECVELNHKIIKYMGDSKSFEDYKKLLVNSKTLKKYEINWDLLEEKVKREILGWDNYLKSLEAEE